MDAERIDKIRRYLDNPPFIPANLEDEIAHLTKMGRELVTALEKSEAENARLRQQVENVEGVLAMWKKQAEEADKHPGGSLMAMIYRAHASLVRDALQATMDNNTQEAK